MTDPAGRNAFRALTITALVVLGHGITEGNGALWQDSIVFLWIAAIAILVCAAFPRMPGVVERLFAPVALALGAIGLATFFARDLNTLPGRYVLARPEELRSFLFVMACAAVLAGVSFAAPTTSRAARWASALSLLGIVAYCGHWVLTRSPSPRIDVFFFHHDAAEALLHGQSPYAITFQDIYTPAETARFYGEGLTVGGRLQFGFPYFPLSLLLVLPAHLWAGDFRYAQLTAIVIAGLCLYAVAPRSRFAALAAALYLFMPRTLFVLEQSWTEPLLVALFAITVWVAYRRPGWLWLPLGLFVAAKQYAFLVAPLAVLLLPHPWRLKDVLVLAAKTAAVGVVITLPFLLWTPDAFIKSVVTLQFHQPFRPEAYSFMAWVFAKTNWMMPRSSAFVGAVLMLALCLWRSPRTVSGFAFSCAAVLFTFFALNKQAFANYYFLVLGMLACALATSELRPRLRSASSDLPAPRPSTPQPSAPLPASS